MHEQLTNLKESREKVVVITHHAPSKQSIPTLYQDDILSAAYASHLDAFLEDFAAVVWVHDHTHLH